MNKSIFPALLLALTLGCNPPQKQKDTQGTIIKTETGNNSYAFTLMTSNNTFHAFYSHPGISGLETGLASLINQGDVVKIEGDAGFYGAGRIKDLCEVTVLKRNKPPIQ